MEKKEIKEITTEVITDIICDSCGESCKVDKYLIDNDKHPDNGQNHCSFEYMKLEARWGYHSNKDLESWTAHVCEKCVDGKLSFINFNTKRTRF